MRAKIYGITAYIHKTSGDWLQQNIDMYHPGCPIVWLGCGDWTNSLFPVERTMDARVASKDATVARNIEFLECLKVAMGRHWEYFITITDTFRARAPRWDRKFVDAMTPDCLCAGTIGTRGIHSQPDLEPGWRRLGYVTVEPGGRLSAYPLLGAAIWNTMAVAKLLGNHGKIELAESLGDISVHLGEQAIGRYRVVDIKSLAIRPYYQQSDVRTVIMAADNVCGGPITDNWQPDEYLWPPGTKNI